MASIALLHGRNSLAWRERVRLEVDYIDRSSVINDMGVFLRGLVMLLLRKGIYNPASTAAADVKSAPTFPKPKG